MAETNEKAAIAAIRAHEGGLGGKLTEARKTEIICGRENKPEKSGPLDKQTF